MAYRRPLSLVQSIIIAVLWVVFVLIYISHQSVCWEQVWVIGGSALFVFYPIIKSLRQRCK